MKSKILKLYQFFKHYYNNKYELELWPIRLKYAAGNSSEWFVAHGWSNGSHTVSDSSQTSYGAMPGWKLVYGWTFHLGRLKVIFGKPYK